MRRAAAVAVFALMVSPARAGQAPVEPQAEAPKIQAVEPSPGRSVRIGVALGPGLDVIVPTSGRATVALVPRLAIRFPAGEGWAPTLGFGWFDTGIDGDQFGSRRRIGELQVRPVMAGARYTWIRGPYSFDISGAAGPSFTDFDLDGEVAATLPRQNPIRAEASTSLAMRVQGGVWYDYNERVSFRGTVGYFRCEPDVIVSAGGVSRRFSQSANAIQFGAGVVYRIF